MEAPEHTLGFDYSHNNKLIIESPSYNDFINYLFSSSFRLGQIKQGLTLEKLKMYDLFIIGNPYNSMLELEEIKDLVQYVKEGGGLFIVSDDGGDYTNETNLSELTRNFGFEFEPNCVYDSMMYLKEQDKVIINNLEPHFITRDVEQFVHSTGCSISVDESIEADENIHIHVLAKTGLNGYIRMADQPDDDIDAPHKPVLVVVEYYKGRVVGLGSLSIFSSLSSMYGFNALDDKILIANIINWLRMSGKPEASLGETKILSLPINMSLALWMEKLVQEKKWHRVADIVNFSIKYFKDNYDRVVNETKERIEKLNELRKQREKEFQEKLAAQQEKREEAYQDMEEDILKLVNKDEEADASELEDIMKELEKFSSDDD